MKPRRFDAGAAVAALGGVLMLVSLFLDWYGDADENGISGWRVFEVLDLVLAVIALLALSTFLARAGVDRRLPEAPLLLVGAIALLAVFVQLVNDPPRVAGLDPSLEIGAWLALAGAALLLAGALMSVARVSLAVERREVASPASSAAETQTVKLDEPPA